MSVFTRKTVLRQRTSGFSLIEVVLAVALLGLTIVAVLGLLGTVSRSVTDVQDYSTAARISEAIQDEFMRVGFDNLTNQNIFPLPIVLYGNRTGDRVVLRNRVETGSALYDPDERNAFPPRDWYFIIEVNRVDQNNYDASDPLETQIRYQSTFSTFLPLRVDVRWPHNIPRGPGADDAQRYDVNKRRHALYHVSVPK